MYKLKAYQTYGPVTDWGNAISDEQHVYAYFKGDMQKAREFYTKVLEFQTPYVTDVIKKFPTKVFDNDHEYYWEIITSARRNVPLVEARTEDGTVVDSSTATNVGVGITPFYLVFATNYFAKGDTIVGSRNEQYPLRIIEEPRTEGTNMVCKVELMGGVSTGMPKDYLLPGERFSLEYDVVEPGMSRKVGDIHFSIPTKMSNSFSTHRLQHKADGNMMNKKVAMGIPFVDKSGNVRVENAWMHYALLVFEDEWRMREANLILYSRSNRNVNGEWMNYGESGRAIEQGAGLYEQVETGNVDYYTNSNEIIPRLTAALEQICYGKIPRKNRRFLCSCGSKAFSAISKYASQDGSGWYNLTSNSSQNPPYLTKQAGNDVPNGVKINNYQVNEWVTPEGIDLIFEIQDYLDDPVRNKLFHHEGGLMSSYRVDIWHIGNDMSEPNIQIARPRGFETEQPLSFQYGLRNPFTGATSNEHMSYDEDSAVVHRLGKVGVIVYDPSRCYSLIPNDSAAV
jgi:hypothetical protein